MHVGNMMLETKATATPLYANLNNLRTHQTNEVNRYMFVRCH